MTVQEEPKHPVDITEKLPAHLQDMAEGAILDWLIRTGRWRPTSPAKLDVQAQQAKDERLPNAEEQQAHS
jgi:hypothetical protein